MRRCGVEPTDAMKQEVATWEAEAGRIMEIKNSVYGKEKVLHLYKARKQQNTNYQSTHFNRRHHADTTTTLPKQSNRKCAICKQRGHNKRTCPNKMS